MITIQGIVKDITFQNEDSGFTVMQLQIDTGAALTCVGIMPTLAAGESVSIQGEWEMHRHFGKQFCVKSYQIVRPTTLEGIAMLLGSGLITNIGPGRAKAILGKFGTETLDILDHEPERLREVPGIGPKMAGKVKEAWERQRHLRKLMLFLQEYGVSISMVMRIFKTYGEQAQGKISENPYCLIDDVWGIGFVKADRIAQKMGYSHDSYKRIRAGLAFVMQEAAAEGHSCLPEEDLSSRAASVLQVNNDLVHFSLDHAIQIKLLIKEDARVYLPVFYYAEKAIARNIGERCSQKAKFTSLSETEISQWIQKYQNLSGWRGDATQVEAVKAAISSSVFLLTGGPGTGKTTVLQVLVSFFREQNRTVSLAAPTGRAAQRMGSVAGLTAQTIHRLLQFKPSAGGNPFQRNEENPLETDILIIDEVSMVDIVLMRQVLAALKADAQLILVGDNNQLPSVGAGNVLADLIASKKIIHVHLTTIFRQAAASRIVTAAHEIISGIVPSFSNTRMENCFFLTKKEPQECLDLIIDLVTHRLPSRYHLNPVSDIQVLSPMHKGLLGTQNINELLQKKLNGKSPAITKGQSVFHTGDKVMQIRNNYDQGVFNGDIGRVVSISEDQGIVVDFYGNRVEYEIRDLEELVPAYCISIHKSQGCEFNTVIIPLTTQHYIMLQRNLLYTALTRAKSLCVLVGTMQALSIAVKNDHALQRCSRLAVQIESFFEEKQARTRK